jgi:hypothetical protein
MKNIFIMSTVLLGVISCGKDSNSRGGGLGSQIDRMGRPAVNTALNNTFTSDSVRGAAEDKYNQTNFTKGSSYIPIFGAQFAIYDALVDEAPSDTGCGDNGVTNRASANPADGLATGDSRYAFLSTVFSDDQLYINASASGGSDAGQCGQYLAAELTVIGLTGLENDCGGRAPNYDVIETTYSAVAAGSTTGVNDGLTADARIHSETIFPFLAGPN